VNIGKKKPQVRRSVENGIVEVFEEEKMKKYEREIGFVEGMMIVTLMRLKDTVDPIMKEHLETGLKNLERIKQILEEEK
jgi:hypothetical protein